jgi:hypothetical protein
MPSCNNQSCLALIATLHCSPLLPKQRFSHFLTPKRARNRLIPPSFYALEPSNRSLAMVTMTFGRVPVGLSRYLKAIDSSLVMQICSFLDVN